jgi:TonB-linked SusC/RagA family outer membrane protein
MLLSRTFYLRLLRKVLLIVFLFVFQRGTAQSFTFSFQRTPLAKVFSQVEDKSDYRFLYTEEVLALGGPVSFTVKGVSLDSVLQFIFQQQPLSYSIEGKQIIVRKKIVEKMTPVNRELRGKVVDFQHEPVAGITVSVKQSHLATATDANGEFVLLNVPLKATLVITGGEIIPMELEASPYNFQLIVVQQRVSVLDETMVIAYGKTSKRFSTSSSSRVTQEEIGKQPVSNPLLALQGRVSGLQISQASGAPGSQVLIQLRGRNSIANGNTPLIILDGVPFPSTTLNNSLAGASLFSTPLDNINPYDIERIDVLKDADATAIYGSRGANGVILITTKKASADHTRFFAKVNLGTGSITRRMDLLSTPQYLSMRKEAFANDGSVMTNANAPDLLLWDTTRYTDWQKVLIGKTVQQYDINMGVSGGNQFTQFMISGGYHKESTVFPGDFGADKISGAISIHHQSLNKRFTLSFDNSYLINHNTLPREDISRRITLAPDAPAIYLPSGALNWENSTWTNPLSVIEKTFTNETEVLNSTISLTYQISKSFSAKISGGYSRQLLKEHGINPQRSFNPATVSSSSANFGRTNLQTLIAEPQLRYLLQHKKHSVDAVVGTSLQQTDQQSLQQTGTGYSSDALLYSIQAASVISTTVDADTKYRYVGHFARAIYQYDKKYLLTLTARRDGSSRYGPANRFANFYSAGAGWVFSKERWFKHQRFLSFGKIRMSTGRSGNDQIGDYRYLDLYSSYSNPYQSVTPFYPTQLFNPEYTWEQVNKKEIGMELGFLNDRFQLTTNYYHNTTKNQLIQYPLPSTTGFTGILKNLPATIRNTGLEIECSGVLIRKPKKSWTFSFNVTLPQNKLIAFDGLNSSSYANTYIVGQSLNIVKRYGLSGVDPVTGVYTFIDYDRNSQLGSPQDEQKVVDGSQQYFGGFQQSLILGRFSFSFLVQFVKQDYAPNYLLRFSRPGSQGNQPISVLNRWRKPGDMTDVQRFSVSNSSANTAFGFYQFSDAGFSDASYVRLRNVYISYDLLTKSLQKAGVKELSVFLQAHNLITLTSYKGLDPETQTFLPPVRLITAGFELNF